MHTYCPDPECGCRDLDITIQTEARVHFDESPDDADRIVEIVYGGDDIAWTQDSRTTCSECGFVGPFYRFQHDRAYGEPQED